DRAVEMLAECEGQVLVAGIGKSGIIAQKIAATLRSTGTPAAFLHASEALHGDLGIVRSQDVVLAVGKSGETGELNTLLRFLKKIGTPIISMTASADSELAALSDLVLELKIPREACPLNLVPTASTTAALAVGDALAVVLMKRKNISEHDFARHHPGGQLGKRLLLSVEDVMRKGGENPIVHARNSIKDMLIKITAFHVGAVSVVDNDGKLLGLVTDYDIRKALESDRNLMSMRIDELMNPAPAVIFADNRAADALELMRTRKKPTAVLPVVDRDRKVVGMIHIHDLISAGL
ncbi:MAG: KpsF/GutQ family sugar-phosphate isomerase, partial [Acidobacteria bacterium]|nr:KpsF/GutQ family sugar-phosphate isomerase [Acidobacteriota bacterium]